MGELDLIFSGRHEVVIVGGRRDFAPDHSMTSSDSETVRTYLAGAYAQRLPPSQVRPEAACDLYGQFVLLRHDQQSHQLHVLTDRFGLLPIYVAEGRGPQAGKLLLSTDLWELVRRRGGSDGLDPAAVSDILAYSVPFDRRTPWRGVGTVAGGSQLTIDLDTLGQTVSRHWRPQQLLAGAELSFEEVKDRLVDLFLEGMSLICPPERQVSVTLSGGADSRCLLAGSLHLGRSTIVYSTGVPGSRALAYAHGMSQLCGVPHHAHPLDPQFLAAFPALMRESSHSMQGMSFSSELEAMWLRQHVQARGVMLHGAFAELFKIGKMHNYPYDASVSKLTGGAVADHIWQRLSTRYETRRLGLKSSTAEAAGEQARQHLIDKVAGHQRELDTAGVLQMIYIEEFLGKVAKSSWNMWRQRLPTHFPFSYPPLVDLMLRVKAADKVSNHFVVYLLNRIHRGLARYPDSNTGARLGASRLNREFVHLIDFAVNRVLRPKARADHQDFADWLARTNPSLEQVFESLQTVTGEYDEAHLQDLIARCRAGDDLAARTLHFLWSWGLWRMEANGAAEGLK